MMIRPSLAPSPGRGGKGWGAFRRRSVRLKKTPPGSTAGRGAEGNRAFLYSVQTVQLSLSPPIAVTSVPVAEKVSFAFEQWAPAA